MQKAKHLDKKAADVYPDEDGGKLRATVFEIKVTEEANEFIIARFGPGRGRILIAQSNIGLSDKEVSLSIGNSAFIDLYGARVAASKNAILGKTQASEVVDTANAGTITGYTYIAKSQFDVILYTSAKVKAGTTIKGTLVYIKD